LHRVKDAYDGISYPMDSNPSAFEIKNQSFFEYSHSKKWGSSEENHLPNFLKSDVIDDVTVTSWVDDDLTCQFS